MAVKNRGRHTIQQDLGMIRSFASQVKHADSTIDEEEFFELIAQEYLKGIVTEVSKIFKPSKASRLLDVFRK